MDPVTSAVVGIGGSIASSFLSASSESDAASAKAGSQRAQAAATLKEADAAQAEGVATGQAFQYNSQVAKNNAIIAEQNADAARVTGAVKSLNQNLATRAKIGSVRAGYGAAGVVVDSGSAADVVASTTDVGALDAATLRFNAEKEAFGFEVSATNFGAEAGLDEIKAANAVTAANARAAGLRSTASGLDQAANATETAGEFDVAKSILGGATSVADKYTKAKSAGIF